jgi:RTX calcium-binding nonapeptide repeat (4 copies)
VLILAGGSLVVVVGEGAHAAQLVRVISDVARRPRRLVMPSDALHGATIRRWRPCVNRRDPGISVIMRRAAIIATALTALLLTVPLAYAVSKHGTRHADTINGTARSDILRGRGGNDHVYGHGGDDVIYGNGGRDTLRGGAGRDALFGGYGGDHIWGGPGADTLVGGPGGDVLEAAGHGGDVVDCGGGFDIADVDGVDNVNPDCEAVVTHR